ncbi:uncharacterized protein BcabD6B2_22620 [Babesia caballi]|uniref:Membrane protein, putative n=1 Tax=Babesia caballi TaxID=5871 RepID=A0AAV4LRG0_BABCB|nr:membrane protein, putative [Babesia caballi]
MTALASFIALTGALWLSIDVEALKLRFVLDGDVYEESVLGDFGSVLDAANSVVAKSSLPFNSIHAVPEHWVVHIKGLAVPVVDYVNNGALPQPIDLQDGDHVYLFRNELAYQDPVYAAEYLKLFTKRFGDRIRPAEKRADTPKKSPTKQKGKSKRRKAVDYGSEGIADIVGILARTFFTGDLASAFGLNNLGGRGHKDSPKESASPEPKASDFMGSLDLLAVGIGFTVLTHMQDLIGTLNKSKTATNDAAAAAAPVVDHVEPVVDTAAERASEFNEEL